jgi:hypothetical protein
MKAEPDVHTQRQRLSRALGLVKDRIKLAKDAGDDAWLSELERERTSLRSELDALQAGLPR